VKLADGSILAKDSAEVRLSKDGGQTWSARHCSSDPTSSNAALGGALLRTRAGAIILAFLNEKEQILRWDQAKGGPQPGCRLPVYVTRSLDEGHTWEDPRLLQDGWCGAIRQMIQLRNAGWSWLARWRSVTRAGTSRSPMCQMTTARPGRKATSLTLASTAATAITGAGIEGTVVELEDDRLWMLLRTSRDVFTEVFSADAGLTWEDNRPSKIATSGSPGTMARLASGRLVLFWNRYIDPVKKTGRREQLSMAFSGDDGRTWSKPVVLGYDPMRRATESHNTGFPIPTCSSALPASCGSPPCKANCGSPFKNPISRAHER